MAKLGGVPVTLQTATTIANYLNLPSVTKDKIVTIICSTAIGGPENYIDVTVRDFIPEDAFVYQDGSIIIYSPEQYARQFSLRTPPANGAVIRMPDVVGGCGIQDEPIAVPDTPRDDLPPRITPVIFVPDPSPSATPVPTPTPSRNPDLPPPPPPSPSRIPDPTPTPATPPQPVEVGDAIRISNNNLVFDYDKGTFIAPDDKSVTFTNLYQYSKLSVTINYPFANPSQFILQPKASQTVVFDINNIDYLEQLMIGSTNQIAPVTVTRTQIIVGCTDPTARNYNPSAELDDGSCQPKITACNDPDAINYNANVDVPDNNSCIYEARFEARTSTVLQNQQYGSISNIKPAVRLVRINQTQKESPVPISDVNILWTADGVGEVLDLTNTPISTTKTDITGTTSVTWKYGSSAAIQVLRASVDTSNIRQNLSLNQQVIFFEANMIGTPTTPQTSPVTPGVTSGIPNTPVPTPTASPAPSTKEDYRLTLDAQKNTFGEVVYGTNAVVEISSNLFDKSLQKITSVQWDVFNPNGEYVSPIAKDNTFVSFTTQYNSANQSYRAEWEVIARITYNDNGITKTASKTLSFTTSTVEG